MDIERGRKERCVEWDMWDEAMIVVMILWVQRWVRSKNGKKG